MKKLMITIMIFCTLTFNRPAYGVFGMDAAMTIPYLVQIIYQAVRQYYELKAILDQAKTTQALLKAVNDGMDIAINLLRALPIQDEKVLGNLKNYSDALRAIRQLYGDIPFGPDADMYRTHDDTIAESLKLVNAIHEYASQQERNAEQIGDQSNYMSPKGSARMTAKTNAAILHTLNQILRINGQFLKLQSENLGLITKENKEKTYQYQKTNYDLQRKIDSFDGDFKVPRF